ncbi:MAG: TlpA family protein disulfide reductase [Gemmatimonadetes bacterium]|nr:TlpA family protein disulfide reductase [Gemmatimonadota bacterium]
MTNRNQWLVIGGVVALLGSGLWFAATQLGDELFPIRIGGEAPDFSAMTLPAVPSPTVPPSAGAAAAVAKGIDDYAGEVVLLNIWATWCKPCRVEMPSMERLEKRLGPKGLRIVAVSIDDPGMEPRIQAFADELGLTFELLYDAPGRIREIYQTTGVPETFIVGRDGLIRRRIIGAEDWSSDANVAFLERLLAEPRP